MRLGIAATLFVGLLSACATSPAPRDASSQDRSAALDARIAEVSAESTGAPYPDLRGVTDPELARPSSAEVRRESRALAAQRAALVAAFPGRTASGSALQADDPAALTRAQTLLIAVARDRAIAAAEDALFVSGSSSAQRGPVRAEEATALLALVAIDRETVAREDAGFDWKTLEARRKALLNAAREDQSAIPSVLAQD